MLGTIIPFQEIEYLPTKPTHSDFQINCILGTENVWMVRLQICVLPLKWYLSTLAIYMLDRFY